MTELTVAGASARLVWRSWFPEQGEIAGVTLKAASEVDMKDQDMVLSIIVNAIQFTLQNAQKAPNHSGAVISPEERVDIARAILIAPLNKDSRSHERHRSPANLPPDEEGSVRSAPLEGYIPMTTKTRPSLPKGKPKNGISQWDNEGGAPSSGDRSRKQGGRTEKPDKPGKKAS